MNNPPPVFKRVCTLLGVPFDISVDVARSLTALIDAERLHAVTTPNPEILMKSLHVEGYREVLSAADVSLPDGTGLLWATTFLKKVEGYNALRVLWHFMGTFSLLLLNKRALKGVINHLHHGSDTFFALHTHWNSSNTSPKVFYFGGEGEVPQRMPTVVAERYPAVEVVGSCGGYPFRSKAADEEILQNIEKARPEVLFVSLPFPKQEQWVMRSRSRLEAAGVRLVMVVGGTFDFMVGKRKRAPQWMTRSGIEWLWRLIQEPSRVGRITNAVLVFPITILLRRLSGKKDLSIEKADSSPKASSL